MKKLCYIANVRVPTEKAHGLAVMKMCEAFAKESVEVELVVARRKKAIQADPFEYYGVKRNFKIKELPCLDLVSWGKLGFLVQWISFAIAALIYGQFNKADYYYGRDELSLWFLSFFKKNIVWEAHTAKNNWYVRILVRKCKTVVISSGLKRHYSSMSLSPEKILVAHSGVDISVFEAIKENKEELREKLSLPLDKKIIAYVGKRHTMGESKGVEELEDVFKTITKNNPDTQLLIVDQEPVARIPLYMKAVDFLIMNYPNTPHYANFMSPLKLFEYMASSTPIISSNLPSIREILDDSSSYFFTPGDRESLVKIVEHALTHEDEGEAKARKSLERVKEYAWSERANKILEFIYAQS